MPIEDDVLALIRGSIRSIWALELLLLLQRDRGRKWNEAELVRELRGSPLIVRDGLTALQAAGAVCGQPDRIRYCPRTDRIADLVGRLVQSYEQRPAAVMRAIAAAPDDRIQTFADAFRFKR